MPVIKPSTRAFFKTTSQKPGFSITDTVHGYIYLLFPYLYIGIATGENRLTSISKLIIKFFNLIPFRKQSNITFADTYHGKVDPSPRLKRLSRSRKI